MKILIVQDRLRSGGTERQAILLAQSFQRAGNIVEVLTFRPGGALQGTLVPVPHISLQSVDTGLDWFAPGLLTAVLRFAPDVVLCMGRMANSRSGGLQRALRRRGSAAAVVGTMRTGKSLPWLFRRSLREVRHVVANSADAQRSLVQRFQIESAKISVIHNALVFPSTPEEASAAATAKAAFRLSQSANDGTFVMLCVGMFRPEKNQRALIEMAATLQDALDWQLWFVGEGSTLETVKSLAKEKGHSARVKFFGFQENPRPFYQAADLAVLTSQSESLSNFLIEAHAHALPSVAFDVMGVKECGGGAVRSGDLLAFQSEVLRLAGDPTARHGEGARLAAFAREAFSPEKQAGEYLRLFERLTGSS